MTIKYLGASCSNQLGDISAPSTRLTRANLTQVLPFINQYTKTPLVTSALLVAYYIPHSLTFTYTLSLFNIAMENPL